MQSPPCLKTTKIQLVMLRLNCFFQANSPEDYKTALEAAVELTLKSRNHEGVVAYDVFESATREDVFMICETWQNQEVLDKHAATPEFEKNVGIINGCGLLKLESFEMK